ncbi:MAG: peptide ABC transporter substrate-binding protein [Firmicutes bacterium]|nr:peptide ABC transporter substrate-binding protein [Bacillota bacterium]
MKGLVILALASLLAAAVLPGCGPGAAEEKVLVVGTTDQPGTLDPADCYDYFGSNILENVAECLVGYEPGTTDLVPCLATEWTASPDGMSYVFKIREGVKFHDGTDLDAEAVKFSIDRARTMGGQPGFLLDPIDKVEVTGDYEVKITLKYPCSPFVSMLGYTVGAIVSPTAYADYTEPGQFLGQQVVATGPYKLTEYVEGSHITLVRNEDYWGTPPFADRVVVKFYSTSAALKMALEKREIDVAYRSFTPLEEEALLASDKLAAERGNSPGIRFLVFNVTKAPFDNVHVRRALAYAVDRAAINETVFQGSVHPLYSIIPDGMWSYKPVFAETYGEAADTEKCLAELAKAGYSASKPLTIELWYTPTHYGDTEDDLAQVLKSQFEATGAIKVELKSSEWGRYTDDLTAGSMGFFLLGWYPDYLDPDDYVTPFLATEGAKSMGCFYSSAQMDSLIKQELAKTTVEDRTPVFESIQGKLAEDVPYIPLFQKPQFVAMQKNVKGVLLEPLMILRYYLIYKDEWK